MEVDANNPVVQLCVEGLAAETAGNVKQALRLYMDA